MKETINKNGKQETNEGESRDVEREREREREREIWQPLPICQPLTSFQKERSRFKSHSFQKRRGEHHSQAFKRENEYLKKHMVALAWHAILIYLI
jgi:uncharacterized C2H2 Zn-finger protein